MVKSLTRISSAGEDLESLAHRAYMAIRDRIICLELPPGAVLSEAALADSRGLSRTPIREALKRLESDYLIAIMPRRGIIVTDVDLRDQLLLLDVRRGIESALFARAAERSSPAQRRRFQELVEEMEFTAGNNDLQRHYVLDREFDTLIDTCAGNRFLTDMLRPVHCLVWRFWQTQRETEGALQVLEHQLVVTRAAAAGAPARVLAATRALFDFNERYIRKLLG